MTTLQELLNDRETLVLSFGAIAAGLGLLAVAARISHVRYHEKARQEEAAAAAEQARQFHQPVLVPVDWPRPGLDDEPTRAFSADGRPYPVAQRIDSGTYLTDTTIPINAPYTHPEYLQPTMPPVNVPHTA